MVRHMVPVLDHWRCRVLSRRELQELRSQPFYYYLLARTLYYDQVFIDAIRQGVRCILNIGCGNDTRAHRFRCELMEAAVTVVECDRPVAIAAKQSKSRRLGPTDHIQFVPIDLNDVAWPALEACLRAVESAPVMVMMEGVSPYIDQRAFEGLLARLGERLVRGSLLAYDYKLSGVADDFGRAGATDKPFRLPGSMASVASFHAVRGLELSRMELSAELQARLVPEVAGDRTGVFGQDCLLQLRPATPSLNSGSPS